ncbi:MAG: hypothetical protein D6731_13860 [Planctomycetota bacterium]|nr:MAG: hypothetical protein D6731_13860 [Planctomycetota bacterium]
MELVEEEEPTLGTAALGRAFLAAQRHAALQEVLTGLRRADERGQRSRAPGFSILRFFPAFEPYAEFLERELRPR